MRILADQSTGTGLAIWAIVLIVIAVILVILFAFIIHWWIKTYNTFRKYQQIIKESLSDIDVALEKRFDLLTKMFDITKGYAKHEHDTLADVVGLRSGIPAGATAKDLSDINTKLDQASNSINIIFEKYPDLKANTLFLELQSSSRDAEEHLQASRRLYNSNVKEYNTLLTIFPSSIIANHYRFEASEYFEAEEAKKADVKMEF